MQKLGGTDASFIYNETVNMPQHVGGIQYVKVAEADRADYFESVRGVLMDRVHLLPYMTSRLQEMPFDIDHPVWVRHENFDIDAHLHLVQLEAPGTQAQLESLCAELYEPMMDRGKPLWDMWVIEGLDNGQVAILSRTHHACIDGMASITVAEILGDYEATPRKVEQPTADFWRTEDVSYLALMRESLVNLQKYTIDNWAKAPARMAAGRRVLNHQDKAVARPVMAPRAPWNAAIDSQRGIAGAQFSLSVLKQIGKATGTKINDVILAITADALNAYLERSQVELAAPMIASCPVSMRQENDTSMNNQVTMMSVSLENQVSEPLVRLSAINEASRDAKELLTAAGDSIVTDFGAPYLPAQMKGLARLGTSGEAANQGTHVPANLVVSNVPGLRRTLYMAGAEVLGTTPLSIVLHGSGLNVTVCSYLDRMDVGLTAATRVVSDVAVLRDDFVAAYEQLAELALTAPDNKQETAVGQPIEFARPVEQLDEAPSLEQDKAA
jgi:diacylglycerol O-acyltransferase / wax synthase